MLPLLGFIKCITVLKMTLSIIIDFFHVGLSAKTSSWPSVVQINSCENQVSSLFNVRMTKYKKARTTSKTFDFIEPHVFMNISKRQELMA